MVQTGGGTTCFSGARQSNFMTSFYEVCGCVCGCVINLISPPLVVDRFQFYYPALSRTFRAGGGGEGHHVRTVLIIKKKAATAALPLLLLYPRPTPIETQLLLVISISSQTIKMLKSNKSFQFYCLMAKHYAMLYI